MCIVTFINKKPFLSIRMEKVVELLQKYTKHKLVELTARGNNSIYIAFSIVKRLNPEGNVLIPDQGGWLTYKNYPKKLGMKFVELKTDNGIINIDDLKNKLDNASCLIYTNPAGYFAEQDFKKIYQTCKGKCLVIMDCSGSIATDMCDGNYADIIVGSFGKWKPVNLGYGGFITTNNQDFFKIKDQFSQFSFDKTKLDELKQLLENVKPRQEYFRKVSEKVKSDLKDFNIIHKDKNGINVIIKYKDDQEKQKIIDYCEERELEFTFCPRYIRVLCDAVSIEVKRL